MDFTAFHTGATALAATIVTALNLTFVPVNPEPADPDLKHPQRISSYNLPDEVVKPSEDPAILTDLASSQDKDIKLRLVTKEAEQSQSLITVEQPPLVYTVVEPTPKPSVFVETKGSKAPEETKVKPEDIKSQDDKKPDDGKTEIVKSPEPSSIPATTPGSPNAEKLFQMINDYRSKLGKPSFEKDERLCKIAESRAPQVDGELASGALHKGFKDLNLPYWATENIAAYATIEDDFKFWLSDYIHKAAIESDHKYSCVACIGASCSEIFSSFVPK